MWNNMMGLAPRRRCLQPQPRRLGTSRSRTATATEHCDTRQTKPSQGARFGDFEDLNGRVARVQVVDAGSVLEQHAAGIKVRSATTQTETHRPKPRVVELQHILLSLLQGNLITAGEVERQHLRA